MRTSLGEYIEEFKSKDKGQNYPVYSVTNSQGFCQEFFGKNVASSDTSNYKVVPRGCFAYNPSRINVGSVACQDKEDFVSVSPLYVVFKVSPELNNAFLMYYLKSNYCMTYIKALSRGAVRNNLHLKTLKTFEIPKYDLYTQEKIVSELDLLSSIIEKKKLQLEELEKLIQSIFYQMFGDPVANEKGWEVKKLENIVAEDCTISYGIVQPGEDVENGIPVVRPIDLKESKVSRKGLKRVEKRISDSYNRTILKGNEILFCVRGTTGIVSIASEELNGCNVTRGITPLSFGNQVNLMYVFSLIKSPGLQSIISKNTRGIALKQINMKDVRQLPITLPPLAMQHKFAEKIEHIESMKSKVQKSLVEIETLFNSRMDYYFN